MTTYKIKFVTGEPDIVLSAAPTDRVHLITQEVRQKKQVPPEKHVRIICSGKELYPDDALSKATSNVLHCTINELAPQAPPRQGQPPRRPPVPPPPAVEQPPLDWLDIVDPGTVLMWIFGLILAGLWLLYIFNASMYDRTSVVMLCMMTIAFLIPCILSYLPWPAFLTGSSMATATAPHAVARPATAPAGAHAAQGAGPVGPLGQSTAVQNASGGAVQRHAHAGVDYVPPRPVAPNRRQD